MENQRSSRAMVNWRYFALIAFIAIAIRSFINFSSELLPGGGGYYPLQVRTVLETGSLGFPDMPFIFYFDAAIVKFISLFDTPISNTLILNVVKTVDVISVPLLLIPLYKLISMMGSRQDRKLILLIALFAVISNAPLMLVSSLQKNSLAILFLFSFISSFVAFQQQKSGKAFIFMVLFFLLTGLTHFGTFSVLLLLLGCLLIFHYKWKAILPLVIMFTIGLAIIAYFDITRFNRLLSIWNNAFHPLGIFSRRASPPTLIMKLFSWLLIFLAIRHYRTSSGLSPGKKTFLLGSTLCLAVLSFPFLDGEYANRLGIFLFIPQILLLLLIGSHLRDKLQKGNFTIFGSQCCTVIHTDAPYVSPCNPQRDNIC